MDVRFINAFMKSATNVLETMAKTSPAVGAPVVKVGNKTWGAVTGIIGMGGETVNGNMILSFNEDCILKIVTSMLMEDFTEISAEVVDAVGELTNMIAGGAKQELAKDGHKVAMATPVVVVGRNMEISQLSKTRVITIPFKTPNGEFVIEANLAATSQR